jgi:hypothetical protein
MANDFLWLPVEDRREALSVAADRSQRSVHVLEKDVWVVWALATLYGSTINTSLNFSADCVEVGKDMMGLWLIQTRWF